MSYLFSDNCLYSLAAWFDKFFVNTKYYYFLAKFTNRSQIATLYENESHIKIMAVLIEEHRHGDKSVRRESRESSHKQANVWKQVK